MIAIQDILFFSVLVLLLLGVLIYSPFSIAWWRPLLFLFLVAIVFVLLAIFILHNKQPEIRLSSVWFTFPVGAVILACVARIIKKALFGVFPALQRTEVKIRTLLSRMRN